MSDFSTLSQCLESELGTQKKYFDGKYWYKQNTEGCEDIAEYLSTIILQNSNITNFVPYDLCTINGGQWCRSPHFLKEGEVFVSFARLYETETGMSLDDRIALLDGPEEKIAFMLQFIQDTADIDCTQYLADTLSVDALLLNTDRHFNNMGLVVSHSENRCIPAPIFDNGKALLSDYNRFPLYKSIDENIEKAVGKPFCANLYRQASVLGFSIQLDYQNLQKDLDQLPGNIRQSRSFEALERQLSVYRSIIPDFSIETRNDPERVI